MTSDQIKIRAQDTELFYKNHFKKYLEDREMILLRGMAEKDWAIDTKEQALLYQGSIAELKEIKKWFEKQVALSLSRFDKEDKPKPGEIIPPIE